ncbi:MAG: prohibitin family protein [Candidatus Pacebacteria bacterium]|nr:prohibitin family protein [Candidatus Paceibacterota bacterium]
MQEKHKRIQTFVIMAVVLTILSDGALLIPLIIGGVIYFYFKKQNKNIINGNKNINMENINLDAIKRKVKNTTGIIIITILGIALLASMIVVIPAGYTGVYHLFGKVRDKEISSGIHLINPLASVVEMSIRTEQYTMSIVAGEGQRFGDDSIEALTKEGLKVGLDMTVHYHLVEDKASDVYRELGVGYEEKILRPEVRSAIREVVASYEAKDIYSDKREEVVGKIKEIMQKNINPRGIEIESVLLRNVILPPMLTQAIEDKLTAEQEAQKYDFILEKEEKEADRKRIEAKGQKDAQWTINQSLTDRYLQYLYIQNLENREGTIYVPYDLPLFRGL